LPEQPFLFFRQNPQIPVTCYQMFP
jgi:hypothetical protein